MSISIIIPVYNGERFIRKCYQSLTNQSEDKWEAIFINDGSTDGSLSMLHDLQAMDSRVKVIDKNNEGVAVARETGIANASGDIITFLDIDDTLQADALQKFETGFSGHDVDVVVAGINIRSEKGDMIGKISYHEKIMTGAEAVDALCDGKLRWQLWAKAFKNSILKDVETPKGIRCAEDMNVCIQAVLNARFVKVLDDLLYDYLQVSTSATHQKAKEIAHDGLLAGELIDHRERGRLGKENVDCVYMLLVSSALRVGLTSEDPLLRKIVRSHFSLKCMRRLPLHKAISIMMYRYSGLNPARYI